MFGHRRTFAIYVSHVAKALKLLNMDCAWRGEGFKAATRALANKPPKHPRFSDSRTPEWLRRFVRAESLGSEFARLLYAAFLFAIRLPSEASPRRRALPDE